MGGIADRIRSLSRELRRRRVYRVAVLYAAFGIAVLQGADLLVGARVFPEWTVPLGVVLVAVGFPVAVALAWALQLTAEGLRTDAGVRPSFGGWVARGIVVGAAVLTSGALGWAGWTLWVRPEAAIAVEPAASDAPDSPDPSRIAVLYFDDHSRERELGYLAAGLTEGLLHELAQVPALEVVSRNAVKAYRDGTIPLDSLVSSLRVGSLVEGSVSRAEGRVKVAVQLVDAGTGAHLDSRLLERPDGDLFALETELAREVALILRARLGTEVRLRQWRRGTTSAEAWSLLRRAAELHDEYKTLWKLNPEVGIRGMVTADSMLAQAERLDPKCVDLPVARGWLAFDLATRKPTPSGAPDGTWSREALGHADRALVLRPEEPRAQELRGVVLAGLLAGTEASVDPGEAESELRRAIALDPRAARAWSSLATLLYRQDRYEEARYAARNAVEADAFLEDAEEVILTLYESALRAGPEEEARSWCEKGRRRFPNSANFVLCQLYLLASFPQVEPELPRARALLDTLLDVASAQNRTMFRTIGEMQVAAVAARAGLPDSARAIIRGVRGPNAPDWVAYYEAYTRHLLGEDGDAVRLLSDYLASYPDTAALARDWWFGGLDHRADFQALISP